MFTVTSLEKNGSAGQDFFFFFKPKQQKCTYCHCHYASPDKFCVYKGKRKLKLLICTFCTLTVFILLCKYFFRKCGKKSLQLGGFREGQSGNSKHNFFFFALIFIRMKFFRSAKQLSKKNNSKN